MLLIDRQLKTEYRLPFVHVVAASVKLPRSSVNRTTDSETSNSENGSGGHAVLLNPDLQWHEVFVEGATQWRKSSQRHRTELVSTADIKLCSVSKRGLSFLAVRRHATDTAIEMFGSTRSPKPKPL